ncbi:MAG: zinc ribbon domain-containing protein [Clostridiales bacterium]|nr:zinc ribbon domain-containing protein [Clostridiales bacterium]
MFCKKCGNELQEGQNFCTRCGNKVSWSVNETQGMYDSPVQENEIRTETPDENRVRENDMPDGGTEYSVFDRVAIKAGNILEIILGIVFAILALLLFSEGSAVLGVIFTVAAVLTILGGFISLFSRIKKNEFTREEIKKKKRNMIIAIIVLVLIVAFLCVL